jgi:amino acid transporter
MSTAMPRSGGDYVFISRGLHPALGVASSLSICIWFFFWTAAYTNWAVTAGAAVAFQVAGSVLNIPALMLAAQASYEIPNILIVGTIILIAVCLIAARSNFLSFKALDVFVALGLLGVLLWIVVLGTVDRTTFINQFNAYAARYMNDPDYYHTVLKQASEAGLGLNAKSTWPLLINMIPFAATIFPWMAAQSAVGGEVKDPGKNFFAGLLTNLFISVLMVMAAMWALFNAAGYDFIMALDYVFVNGLGYALPTPPYFTLFAGLATQSIPLQAIMAVGFICWSLGIPLINCIQVPRWLFAMSLDRVLPEKLSAVSRYGTPWVGVVVMAIGSEIMFIIYTMYASALAVVSAAFGNITATFMVACIAAIFIPFSRKTKNIFQTAPKLATMKIAGIPVMSIAGLLAALFLAWISFMYAIYPQYGANNLPSLLSVAGFYVIGLIVYFVAKAYRARQGLDISLAFEQIPPL